MEALDELERQIQILEDSKSHKNFQVIDPYSIFQGEHANLEKSMETMIQCQNDPLDMIEARIVDWRTCVRIRKLSLFNL